MDHLPLPAGVEKYPIDVPFVCTEEYDNLDFVEYPQRKGWDEKKLHLGQWEKSDHLAPFLQTWLYFGLLSQVLDVEVKQVDFVKDGCITTNCLAALIEEWKSRIGTLDTDAKEQERTRIYALFTESAMVGRWLDPENSAPPIPLAITLSMQILVSTLYTAAMWIWQGDLAYAGAMFNAWGSSTLVMGRMYKDGWCLNTIYAYRNRMNSATLLYISMLGKPDNSDHSSCSTETCTANNVNVQTYQTKHVDDDCRCSFLEVPQEEVMEIVKQGKVPVLRFDGFITVQHGCEYVAISHVWKDGLGNVGNNSLPRCQLEMIAQKVKEVSGNDGFWIDTICVPADRSLKAAALSTMDEVYRKATQVLVLDAWLRKASCKTTTLETYVRIFVCGWMSRLWTFQEAVLANVDGLKIMFADGTVCADVMSAEGVLDSHRSAKTWDDARNFIVSQAPLSTLSSLRIHSDPSFAQLLNPGTKLITIWMASRSRFVTDPGDEFIVFATMLGIDPGPLYLLDKKERMKGLLDMKKEWPHTFLFADGPRLRTPGYQWAPASLLNAWPGNPANMIENAKMGLRTEHGLIISRPGYIFLETKVAKMSPDFLCKDVTSGKWFTFRYDHSVNPKDVPQWESISPQKGFRTACLTADRRTADNSRWALLVKIDREEGGIIYATFGCRLIITLSESTELNGWSEMLAPWNRPDEEKAKEMNLWSEDDCLQVFGKIEQLHDEQKWCIG